MRLYLKILLWKKQQGYFTVTLTMGLEKGHVMYDLLE